MRYRLIVFGFMWGASQAAGQTDLMPSDSACQLSILTDVDSAVVVLNGKPAGKTPFAVGGLAPGMYMIRVMHPDLENWFSPVIEDSVDLLPRERRVLEYRLGMRYLIRSDPSGAEIHVGNRIIGTTPFFFDQGAEDSVLILMKPGFESGMADLNDANRGVLQIAMTARAGEPVESNLIITESKNPSPLPLLLSGVSALVAGGFSAHEKMRADEAYSAYVATGDPVKRAEARKLDSIAGISLAASQVCLALFAYLLLSP